jgi:dephospho-CoA kinase
VPDHGKSHVWSPIPSLARFRETLHTFTSSTIAQLTAVHPTRSQSAGIPIVGIVGGVGAGKSSIVRRVTSLKLHFVDADRIGHEQLLEPEIQNQLVAIFGTRILNSDGNISRPQLAAEVFGDSEEQKKRRSGLNAIVHPAIRAEMRRQIQTAPHDADAIVLDAALLLEAGWAAECSAIVFIDTLLEQRQLRVAQTRGWSAEEHQRREASQMSLVEKRRHCQFIVDNTGSPEAAALQMEQILRGIIENFRSSSKQLRPHSPLQS